MWFDERRVAFAAATFAILGIALLLLLSENPKECGIGEALLQPENTLVRARGVAANVTDEKFLLCEARLCISVRKGEAATARLVEAGDRLEVTGRLQEYRKSKYLEAASVEVEG